MYSDQNKKYYIVSFFILVITIFVFVFLNKKEIKNYPNNNEGIVIFGDSLAYGIGSTKDNDIASLLSKKINKKIINLGNPGDTTADALRKLSLIENIRPNITLISIGGNDFIRKIGREIVKDNLIKIIKEIQNTGSITVILAVRDGLIIDNAEEMYKEVAESTGSIYVSDILNGIMLDTRYMYDAIHPNDKGYAIVTDKIYSEIKDYIK